MKWSCRLRSVHLPPPLSFPSSEALVPAQPSSRRARLLVKGEPDEESPPFFPTSRGDVSLPAPASLDRGRGVYVTEAPRIRDLDHSSRLKSETHGEITGGGTPRQNGESDFSRTMGSDVSSRDMSVHRPLRPW